MMTPEEIAALLECNDEYLEWERVENKRSTRPDMHAFLLLDSLKPGSTRDMVCGAEHDQIWLNFSLDDLAEIATPELLIELHRCGVLVDEDNNCLFMFA